VQTGRRGRGLAEARGSLAAVMRTTARWVLLAATFGLVACTATNPQRPAALSTLGPACGTETGSLPEDARDPIGRFDGAREVRAWMQMWNRFDLDRVDALFVRDPRLTYFSSEKPGIIAGIDALREHHRGFGFVPGGADRGSRLWLEAVQAHTYGSVVVVTATWLFQRAGAPAAQRGPVTLVLLNEGSGCRIVHAHFANDPPVKAVPAKETADH
jgi:hypothetical protein